MIPFLRNTIRRGIVAKVRTIYESARKIAEFFPELCFLWTKVGVFGDETGGFLLNSGCRLPIGMPSKLSKGLCDLEKCRRNLRKGFATPKSLVVTYESNEKGIKKRSMPKHGAVFSAKSLFLWINHLCPWR